jgi:hypothetical protein
MTFGAHVRLTRAHIKSNAIYDPGQVLRQLTTRMITSVHKGRCIQAPISSQLRPLSRHISGISVPFACGTLYNDVQSFYRTYMVDTQALLPLGAKDYIYIATHINTGDAHLLRHTRRNLNLPSLPIFMRHAIPPPHSPHIPPIPAHAIHTHILDLEVPPLAFIYLSVRLRLPPLRLGSPLQLHLLLFDDILCEALQFFPPWSSELELFYRQ